MNIDKDLSVQFSADQEEVNFLWNGIYEYNQTIGPIAQ
jgi:hypothetical protein